MREVSIFAMAMCMVMSLPAFSPLSTLFATMCRCWCSLSVWRHMIYWVFVISMRHIYSWAISIIKASVSLAVSLWAKSSEMWYTGFFSLHSGLLSACPCILLAMAALSSSLTSLLSMSCAFFGLFT